MVETGTSAIWPNTGYIEWRDGISDNVQQQRSALQLISADLEGTKGESDVNRICSARPNRKLPILGSQDTRLSFQMENGSMHVGNLVAGSSMQREQTTGSDNLTQERIIENLCVQSSFASSQTSNSLEIELVQPMMRFAPRPEGFVLSSQTV